MNIAERSVTLHFSCLPFSAMDFCLTRSPAGDFAHQAF
jgi:hypothetical protein